MNKNEKKIQTTKLNPLNGNGLAQLMRVGNSVELKWVTSDVLKSALILRVLKLPVKVQHIHECSCFIEFIQRDGEKR